MSFQIRMGISEARDDLFPIEQKDNVSEIKLNIAAQDLFTGVYHVSHRRQRKPHAHITHVFTFHVETGDGIVPLRCRTTGRLRRNYVWFFAQRFAEYRSAEIHCRCLTPASLSYAAFAKATDDAVGPVCIVYPTQKAAKVI